MGRKQATRRTTTTVGDVVEVCRQLAPLEAAQDWDNVGLLAGDPAASVQRVLLAIDLTPQVAAECVQGRYEFVLAYHPPIFKPIKRLTADAAGPEAAVFACVAAGAAVYSMHTALDAAPGGTNDVLAGLAGLADPQPLVWDAPAARESKLVVFVPASHLEAVAEALFAAGAGRIGDYEKCSYRLDGEGTFFGGEATQPAVGRKGVLEKVAEVRLETVCPNRSLPQVVAALRETHPYEEPAFDIYPLTPRPRAGIGRVGRLARPCSLKQLAARLKKGCAADRVEVVGDPAQSVERLIIVAGAAGSLPFQAGLGPGDAVITGEMRHHDALSIARAEAAAVVLGHWHSERPTLASLARRLAEKLAGVNVQVSTKDAAPLRAL
jgi:dinuclear metal center YbgI/SA1388 family protein